LLPSPRWAWLQQLDVYGEVLDWAFLYRSLGGRLDRRLRDFLSLLADFVVAHWQEPDQGIWEMRCPPRNHVYGKIMSWVALDRVIRMFGPRDNLKKVREDMFRTVVEQGLDRSGRFLLQAFGEPGTDAVLLLAPMVGFPLDRSLFEATVTEIQRTLQQGDFLRRYKTPDGLEGEEGAFLICSFWLVDALLLLDRPQKARQLFDRLLACANDVGLFSEEIDPRKLVNSSIGYLPVPMMLGFSPRRSIRTPMSSWAIFRKRLLIWP
jgi:GH15 family glucan-1,4-alpha-glucosidase